MRYRLIHILILSLLAIACSKEQETTSRNDDEKSYIDITTRTVDTDDDFSEGSSIRLAIYDHGTNDIHLVENLNYVYAEMSSTGWLYSYDEGKTKNKSFGFLRNIADKIDIVGVHPYIKDQDLSKVDIITNTNYAQKPFMWAASKELSLENDEIDVILDFKHIMSALYFDVKLKNRVDGVIISSISLKTKDKDGKLIEKLPSKSSIDFTQGTIITADSLESGILFRIEKELAAPNYELKHHIYIPPFKMAADDKLEISFVINGQGATTKAISITGAELNNEKVENMQGMRYILPIEIGNYLKFSGKITKETQWKAADTINVEY